MVKAIIESQFLSLPPIGLTGRTIDDFVLDTEFYEKQIAIRNGGIGLGELHKYSHLPQTTRLHYEKIVPYHHQKQSSALLVDSIEKNKGLTEPLAKEIKNLQELEMVILAVYQIAYAHYALAKDYGFKNNTFPLNCCGISGRGLMASLVIHGFVNVAYALSEDAPDHSYVMLPFAMLEPKINGVILADPTSDQLGKYKGKIHRNLTAIKLGTEWDYITEYGGGKDLFPDSVLYFGCLSEEGVILPGGRLTDNEDLYFKNGKGFLEKAYSNPVSFQAPIIG